MRNLSFTILFSFLFIIACTGNDNQTRDVAGRNYQPSQPQPLELSSDPEIKELKGKIDKQNPEPELLFQLAERYLELRATEEARETINKSLKKDPDNIKYKILHANTFADEGKTSDAEKIFNQLIENYPDNVDVYLSWGVMYYNKAMRSRDPELFKAALEKFEHVLDIDDANYKALFNSGLVYQVMNDAEKSRTSFEKAHSVDPEMITPIIHLARLEADRENWEKAGEYAEKGLEIKGFGAK